MKKEKKKLPTIIETKEKVSIAGSIAVALSLVAITFTLGLFSIMLGLMYANFTNTNLNVNANLNTNTNQSLSFEPASIPPEEIPLTMISFQDGPFVKASEFTDSLGNINWNQVVTLADETSRSRIILEWIIFLLNVLKNGPKAESAYEKAIFGEVRKKYDHCNKIDEWFLSIDTDAGDSAAEATEEAYEAALNNAEATCEDAVCEARDNDCTGGSWLNPEACEPYPPGAVKKTCQKLGVFAKWVGISNDIGKWVAIAAYRCHCRCKCQ